MKFDLFPDNKYPASGIFRTASASDCKICVLSKRIFDIVFLILIRNFLEKFCSMYNSISFLGVYHNVMRQIMYCS